MQLCIGQFSYENLFQQILTCKLKGIKKKRCSAGFPVKLSL